MRCPIQSFCIAGKFAEGDCPAYQGSTVVEGLPALHCVSSESLIVIVCPKCTSFSDFRPFDDKWVCKECGYYKLYTEADRYPELDGYALPVRCVCGHRDVVIPLQDNPISAQTWICPKCNLKTTIFKALEKE